MILHILPLQFKDLCTFLIFEEKIENLYNLPKFINIKKIIKCLNAFSKINY